MNGIIIIIIIIVFLFDLLPFILSSLRNKGGALNSKEE